MHRFAIRKVAVQFAIIMTRYEFIYIHISGICIFFRFPIIQRNLKKKHRVITFHHCIHIVTGRFSWLIERTFHSLNL